MYHLVKHFDEYAIKDNNNILYISWKRSVNLILNEKPCNFILSSSYLSQNTIITSADTIENLLHIIRTKHIELLI